jgi:hypothetical protein
MPLTTNKLVMIGLGVLGDTPPNPHQPPLVDGIHLRWSFERDLGFPWFGFYLFRRPSQQDNRICLSSAAGNLPSGTLASKVFDTAIGQVSSDTDLVLTDDFPPDPSAFCPARGRVGP